MGRIVRTIALNPVEPAQFSFRAPHGMQTVIDINLLDGSGNPYKQDVVAQLQLIGRSSARTLYYTVPATDIVNGMARAVIPTGDLSDRNGYNLRLFGTVDGNAELIGIGVVAITQSTGPIAMPTDVIDTIPLNLDRGMPVSINLKLWQDVGKATPFDLATATISSTIYGDSSEAVVIVPFTVTTVGPGEVELTLTTEQADALPDSCWWNLRASSATGVITLAEGPVTITGVP